MGAVPINTAASLVHVMNNKGQLTQSSSSHTLLSVLAHHSDQPHSHATQPRHHHPTTGGTPSTHCPHHPPLQLQLPQQQCLFSFSSFPPASRRRCFYRASCLRMTSRKSLRGALAGPLLRAATTLSASPYSTASSGLRYMVREQSRVISSVLLRVHLASMSMATLRLCSTSLALMAMSEAWPRAMLLGWWSMIEAFGSTCRCPRSPMASSRAPAPKAWPTAMVCTGQSMYFMVSAMAKASVSKPTCLPSAVIVPGLLM
mmetsp:Transcript_29210/g.46038  ORF Transcript_29210/g.46038 Transcript_29210/m.46038 type:complete len:258 (+) Transcript_29210:109-882(+)